MADNGMQQVDPATGAVRQVVRGALAFPADLAVAAEGGRETLHVADVFAYRTVDGRSGAVTDVARSHATGSRLEYPTGVSVGADRVILASGPHGAVQVYAARRGGGAHPARVQGAIGRSGAAGRVAAGGEQGSGR
jgi:hypothetical protein